MNEAEFREQRARRDVPHDDEITWDAHDRVPQRTTEFGINMPSRGCCLVYVLIPVLAFVTAYFLQ